MEKRQETKEFLEEDINFDESFSSGTEQFIDQTAKMMVETKQRLKWAHHYLNDALKRNHELSAKLEQYENRDKQIKELQSTHSFSEMVSKITDYHLESKKFVVVFVNGQYQFTEIAGTS